MKKETAAVAMSGGIDSTLAAALLIEEGYEVVGTTLKFRCVGSESEEGWERSCCAASSATRAQRVAHALGIPHFVIDAEREFESDVIRRFRDAYLDGLTPNPCVECNARIKFGYLLEKVRSWGIDRLATGHYARSEWDEKQKRTLLLRGADHSKDQSYFLWRLSQDQLRSTLFPVGGLTKERVLEEVRRRALPVGNPVESQDVCFVPRGDYVAWLESQVPPGTGRGWFRDTSGRILGEHDGIYRYTIGQRRGLGLSLGRPRYVVRIDPDDYSIVIGDDADLLSDGLFAEDANLISLREVTTGTPVVAKIRYQHTPCPARLEPSRGGLYVRFETRQRAVTPGQSVVFYRDDEVVGGAVIRRAQTGRSGSVLPDDCSSEPREVGSGGSGCGQTKGLTDASASA